MLRTSVLPFPDESESRRRRLLVCRIAQQNRNTFEQIIDSDLENNLDSSDSDDETPPPQKKRQPNKVRDHLKHHESMMHDYFNEAARYNSRDFCRRFRMERGLVVRIIQDLTEHYPYFVQKADCTGKLGLSPHQKITAAIRQLAYGLPLDATDEYCRLAETTARQNLEIFCGAIQEFYGPTYLRAPTRDDLKKILEENAARGFPGCIGSLDCMHWAWKNCPTESAGQFEGKEKTPTIVLEATATKDTWIWHSFFGTPGCLNNKNVLDRSPLFQSLLDGTSWGVEFQLGENRYTMPYYLVDGIYDPWATLVQSKSLSGTADRATKIFVKRQEAVRKDIKRTFGILQGQFQILKKPAMQWYPDDITAILKTCIILHNMIVESRADTTKSYPPLPSSTRLLPPQSTPYSLLQQRIREVEMRSPLVNQKLVTDLISNLWDKTVQSDSSDEDSLSDNE